MLAQCGGLQVAPQTTAEINVGVGPNQTVLMRDSVLIVDDEPDMVELIAAQLRAAGYRIATALNGEAAVRQAEILLPDLIVLDLMLPDIDGFTICEMLRRRPSTAGIPILILTGMSGEMARFHGLECGAIDYLRKPFESHDLVERVRQGVSAGKAQKHRPESGPEGGG